MKRSRKNRNGMNPPKFGGFWRRKFPPTKMIPMKKLLTTLSLTTALAMTVWAQDSGLNLYYTAPTNGAGVTYAAFLFYSAPNSNGYSAGGTLIKNVPAGNPGSNNFALPVLANPTWIYGISVATATNAGGLYYTNSGYEFPYLLDTNNFPPPDATNGPVHPWPPGGIGAFRRPN